MDISELQKYLEKIDFNALSKDNVKLSEDDAYVGELYNSAIDNIRQYNIDVAKIKLSRVVKLDPTFEKAKILLERINNLESDKSFSEKIVKMEETLDKKDEKERPKEKRFTKSSDQERNPSDKKKVKSLMDFLPLQRKNLFTSKKKVKMTPLTFIKMQMTVIVVLLVIILILVIIILSMKNKYENYISQQPDLQKQITLLQSEKQEISALFQNTIIQYEDKIKKLEDDMNSSDSVMMTSLQETDVLIQQNKLYYGKYLALTQKYNESLKVLNEIDLVKASFSPDDNSMYNETIAECKRNISISLYNSGNKLYQDLKYREAYDNFYSIWQNYPDYDSAKIWNKDNTYSNIIFDSVYKMSKCAFEIGEYNIAIEGYNFVENSQSDFAKANKEGIIYHSAKAYAGIEDYIKAEELFKKVINEFPNSDLVTYAKERLIIVQQKLGR